MKKTICRMGHYFDADTYGQCPVCGKISAIYNEEESNDLQAKNENMNWEKHSWNLHEERLRAENSDSEKNDTEKTLQLSDEAEMIAGWLVCIKGNNRGRYFALKTGENYIGKDYDKEVCLKEEPSVPEEVNICIIYQEQKIQYLIERKSDHTILINKEKMSSECLLKNRAKITIGECELLFVAFCSEDFTWNMTKEEGR